MMKWPNKKQQNSTQQPIFSDLLTEVWLVGLWLASNLSRERITFKEQHFHRHQKGEVWCLYLLDCHTYHSSDSKNQRWLMKKIFPWVWKEFKCSYIWWLDLYFNLRCWSPIFPVEFLMPPKKSKALKTHIQTYVYLASAQPPRQLLIWLVI